MIVVGLGSLALFVVLLFVVGHITAARSEVRQWDIQMQSAAQRRAADELVWRERFRGVHGRDPTPAETEAHWNWYRAAQERVASIYGDDSSAFDYAWSQAKDSDPTLKPRSPMAPPSY